jgi:PAS domain-containing protein
MHRDVLKVGLPPGGWRDAAAAAGFAAWRCDLDLGDRLTWTPGVFEMFGVSPADPLDRRDIVALYDPASRRQLEQLRSHAIATGVGFSLDARIVRPDGAPRWIRIVAEPIVRDGRSVALHGVKRDITAQVGSMGSLPRR